MASSRNFYALIGVLDQMKDLSYQKVSDFFLDGSTMRQFFFDLEDGLRYAQRKEKEERSGYSPQEMIEMLSYMKDNMGNSVNDYFQSNLACSIFFDAVIDYITSKEESEE